MRTPESTLTDPDELIRFGHVVSVDLAAGTCVVEIDDNLRTGPIRWAAPRMGQTRVWARPPWANRCWCCARRARSARPSRWAALPATPSPAGNGVTDLIRFRDGAVLSYDPASPCSGLRLPDGGKLALTGDLAVSGTITAQGDVTGAGISLAAHRHGGVQGGSGQSGVPL
jgi:phage baseplate assembly protein gpV